MRPTSAMEFSDFLTQYMNQTEDDFNKDAADYGKQVAGNMLVVCAIAKAEKIDPDTLYDEKVAQMQSRAVIQMLQLWRRITARSICVR